MNKWILIGNLTKDPKLFYSEKGTAVCVFPIAAQSGYGKHKKVVYPQVVTYGKKAEAHAKYLHKGDKISVTGAGYQKKNVNNGKTYYNLQVLGEDVNYILTNGQSNGNEPEEDYNPPALEDDDFDVPF